MINVAYMIDVGVFALFADVIKNSTQITMIVNVLDVIKNVQKYMDDDFYSAFILEVVDSLRAIPKKITDDDIKNSAKQQIK